MEHVPVETGGSELVFPEHYAHYDQKPSTSSVPYDLAQTFFARDSVRTRCPSLCDRRRVFAVRNGCLKIRFNCKAHVAQVSPIGSTPTRSFRSFVLEFTKSNQTTTERKELSGIVYGGLRMSRFVILSYVLVLSAIVVSYGPFPFSPLLIHTCTHTSTSR
jgi:hypothetical protein